MKATRPRLLALALLGALMILPAPLVSLATPLPPGSVLANPVVGTPAYTLGNVPANYSKLLDTLVSPYSGNFAGTLTSFVWQDLDTGYLAFAYRLTNTTTGTGILPSIVMASIGDLSAPWLGVNIVNAGADGSGSSTPAVLLPKWSNGNPYALLRDINANGAGVSAQFRVLNQGTQLNPPADFSALIWFATTSTLYQQTGAAITDTFASAEAYALAPAVPEPATLVLWGLGFGALGIVAVRRKR